MARTRKTYNDKGLTGAMQCIAKSLTAAREALGLSQRQLAKKSRIGLATINELESGATRDLRLSTIFALAKHLKADPREWLWESDVKLSHSDKSDLAEILQKLQLIQTRI